MLNRGAICLGVLCVLFISSTVLAQSQSTTDTIIEKIYESERRVSDHVDKKVEGIDTKISDVNTKVGALSTDVAVNKTNITNITEGIRDLKGTVDWIWRGILGILVTLIVSIGGYFLRSWRKNQSNEDNVDAVDRLAEQITNLTSVQAETSAQITRLISAQVEISETRDVPGHPKGPIVDELDGLTDDLRPTPHDARDRV